MITYHGIAWNTIAHLCYGYLWITHVTCVRMSSNSNDMTINRYFFLSWYSRYPVLNSFGTDALDAFDFTWVRSRNCGCFVTWFCYQLIAKPGNKTAAVSWPGPHNENKQNREQRPVFSPQFSVFKSPFGFDTDGWHGWVTTYMTYPSASRVASLTQGQSCDCPSVSETVLKNMG